MQNINEIRTSFLSFFEHSGHKIVPSSSLVPENDATLMFTNAGMVPFKNVFTGLDIRDYTRAASAQKCVRAGGKHNDLDNVGYTARHHTFFEMLGNFSFGDYFKEEAIFYAWEFLTKTLSLPKEKLLVTVYHEDMEARSLWKKIAGFSDDKIISIQTNDNFWSMGDTGPCGPCSEIFYDHGDKIWGGPPGSKTENGDRFVEIWNLVFMQYDQVSLSERIDLPKPSIDTGAGIERLAAVLQGVASNYDTDLFKQLINAIADASNVHAVGDVAVSHRVIADHLRSAAFLIADGVLPSNEGRGYVLRRIMRRAMRHAHLLGAKEPMIWRIVPTLVQEMGGAYTQLQSEKSLIIDVIKDEEERFGKTLTRGLELLHNEVSLLSTNQKLSGQTAFKLYDTYGFPLDLTLDVLRGLGREVELESFEVAMQEQQNRARVSWSGSGDVATDAIWFAIKNEFGASQFIGYDTQHAPAKILAIIQDGALVESVAQGGECYIVLDKTPFYAEAGGQASDRGIIYGAEFSIDVLDVQKKLGDLYVHRAVIKHGVVHSAAAAAAGTLAAAALVGTALVNAEFRGAVSANHSATHLLHKVLRHRLGDSVTQKGSSVMSDRLRFDFAYNKALTLAEINAIEIEVNSQIQANNPVFVREILKEQAVAEGAMALFGEKYGDVVRLVSMGPQLADDSFWSMELCGGTHAKATGDIGVFKIVSQSSVSAGVRRIEALTGLAALTYINDRLELLDDTARLLKTTDLQVAARAAALLDEKKALEKRNTKSASLQNGQNGQNAWISDIEQVGDVQLLTKILTNVAPRELKPLMDEAKKFMKSGIIALVALDDDFKASVVVGVTTDLLARYNAIELVRILARELGGSNGGGRPDLAQAGGAAGQNAEQALLVLKTSL